MGFTDRPTMRRTFYLRARLLYDLRFEPDRLQNLQAMLLLTYWVEDSDDDRAMWFWMSAAKSLLQLSDFPAMLMALPQSDRQAKLLRRIWWASFVRDTMLAVSIRRRKFDEYVDIPISIVTFGDFDLAEPSPDSRLWDDTSVSDADGMFRQRWIEATLFIGMAKLCLCMNRVASIASTTAILSRGRLATADIDPASFMQNLTREVAYCEGQLEDWSKSQSLDVFPDVGGLRGDLDMAVHGYLFLVQLTFLATVGSLYRPLVFPSPYELPQAINLPKELRWECLRKLRAVAQEIASLSESILANNMAENLPSFVFVTSQLLLWRQKEQLTHHRIFPLTLAGVVHLLQIKSGSGNVPAARRDLEQCRQVLRKLAERYDHARLMTSTLSVQQLHLRNVEPPGRMDDDTFVGGTPAGSQTHLSPGNNTDNLWSQHISSRLPAASTGAAALQSSPAGPGLLNQSLPSIEPPTMDLFNFDYMRDLPFSTANYAFDDTVNEEDPLPILDGEFTMTGGQTTWFRPATTSQDLLDPFRHVVSTETLSSIFHPQEEMDLTENDLPSFFLPR